MSDKRKVDILAFGAHPDDVELGCGGTLLKHLANGKKIGIIDITFGDKSTRGSVVIRQQEAKAAAKILNVDIRENLGFEDCYFENDRNHQLKVVRALRKYRPQIVLANAIWDRHPDHSRASKLISDACFISGLMKIETKDKSGKKQQPWRPNFVYNYIQFYDIQPNFIIDISDYFDQKMEAIKAHKSQFYDPSSTEPETLISSINFLEHVKARCINFGMAIGSKYGEGFTSQHMLKVNDLFDVK